MFVFISLQLHLVYQLNVRFPLVHFCQLQATAAETSEARDDE